MIFKTLSKHEAKIAMDEWINTQKIPELTKDYQKIRAEILNIYEGIKGKKEYELDLYFGVKLYSYFESKKEFNMRLASDDGFWRYLSLKVIPDIVAERWGVDNPSHYYERGTRIWLKSIWWYIYLSWQTYEEDTIEILKNNTTDEILNLVERAGRYGYYKEVYRNIMYFFSKIPQQRRYITVNGKNDRLFRRVMKLNTARCMVIEPSLYLGGERQYVKDLFKDLGERV